MSTNASSQLEAIHAMMQSGHRSVTMERHTLMLWGLAAAFLILTVDALFTEARFPEVWQRSLAANSFIAAVLLAIGVWDFRLTRGARHKRGESVSFVQIQVTKVWWLLIGLIVLINIGMNFFGGGYLFYGITLALMGLAFFVNGLFSQQMLAWIGSLMILIGLATVALRLPYALQEWLATFVFGVGFPFLAFILDKARIHATFGRRAAITIAWLAAVIAPALAVYQFDKNFADPNVPIVDLQTFINRTAESSALQVVRLPAGTTIPVRLELSGNILDGAASAVLPLKLAQPVELALTSGELDGRFRIGGGDWKHRIYDLSVSASSAGMQATLTPERGPEVVMKARMTAK